MSVVGCMQITQDDVDVAENAIRSMALIADEIRIVDTGPAALRQNVRTSLPSVREFCILMRSAGYPITYDRIDWGVAGDHALVHNLTAARVAAQFDWIVWVDSDEFLSDQLAARLKEISANPPEGVVTVASRLLTLHPDEAHYSVRYSQMLSHGRFYRPTKVNWVGAWHEHQNYQGERLNLDTLYHVHLRQLLANRCRRQHGHGAEAWAGIDDEIGLTADLGATWPPIIYPEEDRPRG